MRSPWNRYAHPHTHCYVRSAWYGTVRFSSIVMRGDGSAAEPVCRVWHKHSAGSKEGAERREDGGERALAARTQTSSRGLARRRYVSIGCGCAGSVARRKKARVSEMHRHGLCYSYWYPMRIAYSEYSDILSSFVGSYRKTPQIADHAPRSYRDAGVRLVAESTQGVHCS